MKNFVIAMLFLTATTTLFAQTQSCLAVFPAQDSNKGEAAYIGAFTMGAGLLLLHGEKYGYVDSANLSVKKIKKLYKKKELVKLENEGVQVLVITERGTGCK
jgi:hypothetical protein